MIQYCLFREFVQSTGDGVATGVGFDSLTAKYELAERLGQHERVEVLHIGDHDPSGLHLFSSMQEDVRAIALGLGLDTDIRFSRLAVVPAQITALGLVTAPAKPTDKRAFTGETVQCEAIPPDVLADIIREVIESRLDQRQYTGC